MVCTVHGHLFQARQQYVTLSWIINYQELTDDSSDHSHLQIWQVLKQNNFVHTAQQEVKINRRICNFSNCSSTNSRSQATNGLITPDLTSLLVSKETDFKLNNTAIVNSTSQNSCHVNWPEERCRMQILPTPSQHHVRFSGCTPVYPGKPDQTHTTFLPSPVVEKTSEDKWQGRSFSHLPTVSKH